MHKIIHRQYANILDISALIISFFSKIDHLALMLFPRARVKGISPILLRVIKLVFLVESYSTTLREIRVEDLRLLIK